MRIEGLRTQKHSAHALGLYFLFFHHYLCYELIIRRSARENTYIEMKEVCKERRTNSRILKRRNLSKKDLTILCIRILCKD